MRYTTPSVMKNKEPTAEIIKVNLSTLYTNVHPSHIMLQPTKFQTISTIS